MPNILTATRHDLNFNSLSYEKFEELCFWLVEDSGEYSLVEYYGGGGDKNRDVVGYSSDHELDYYQCKRYEDPSFSILKKEIDGLTQHISTGEIKIPRRLIFVLSSSASPNAKDKIKKYTLDKNLPEPAFWEPVILDKKTKKNSEALENFFGIVNIAKVERLPQVDVVGLISCGTQETTFTVVNNGEVNAVDCSWQLVGFGWPGYMGGPTIFNLEPGQKIDLRIAMPAQFMSQNPIKELRLRFQFRDSTNNWFYSERYLIPELVPSGSFYRISPVAGAYIPARPLQKLFTITSIDQLDRTGLNESRLISYEYNGVSKTLKINISTTLSAIWQFTSNEIESAFMELSEKQISKMIKTGQFNDDFYVNTYIKPTQSTGFLAYKELRENI